MMDLLDGKQGAGFAPRPYQGRRPWNPRLEEKYLEEAGGDAALADIPMAPSSSSSLPLGIEIQGLGPWQGSRGQHPPSCLPINGSIIA